jgi:hypothetical protein
MNSVQLTVLDIQIDGCFANLECGLLTAGCVIGMRYCRPAALRWYDGHALSLGAGMAHEINTALFYWSVSQRLPVAHAADVDVHEVRAAIIPHSSAMQAQGCVTQLRRWNPK